MESTEEVELIKRAKADDQTAFNILFNSYWEAVYSLLNDRTLNSNLAEELAIETFSKAFDKLSQFDQKQPFIAWILTIAKNHHIDRFRKTQKKQETHTKIDDLSSYEPSDLEPSPEDLMISNQDLDLILTHVKSLKTEYRTILKMRYFEDLSYKEIETQLGESASTVRVKLFRAKKMLATLLNYDVK
jgi:RNA polymerase sigma-70 factor (ECF subfamily)